MSEQQIRNRLAGSLDQLEPGLTLVRSNYPLPNTVGTRGFVDVLAKDRSGMYVVIELKRSDSSAREAIHEVLKYVELLQRERKLPPELIRAMVVSTTWLELLVPFSSAARLSIVPLHGKHLEIDETDPRLIVGVTNVVPLEVPLEPRLSSACVVLEVTRDSVAATWDQVVDYLAAVGIDDVVGIELQHDSGARVVHVALGYSIAGDPRRDHLAPRVADEDEALVGSVGSDLIADEDVDVPQTNATGDPAWIDDETESGETDTGDPDYDDDFEWSAATFLAGRLDVANVSSPRRLARIEQQREWTVLAVRRAGAFAAQSDLVSDSELIDEASGLVEIQYKGAARPMHELRWRRFRSLANTCMAGAAGWEVTLNAWLDECESVRADWDVVIHIYNPCDLVAGFVFSDVARLADLVPSMMARANKWIDSSGEARPDPAKDVLLRGCLMWNGQEVDVRAAFRSVFESDFHWWIARSLGELWTLDSDFVARLGLTYELVEFQPGDEPMALLEASSSGVSRRFGTNDDWADKRGLPEFLDRFGREMVELGERLRSHATDPDPFGAVLVTNIRGDTAAFRTTPDSDIT